jgi:phosphatidylethanolamine-binding protein (PEBP) family uncharacterized protein
MTTPRPAAARLSWLLATVAVLAGALVACGSSGTELRDPPEGVTSPAPTSTTTSTTAAPAVFTISSPRFTLGGPMPDTYTCAGANVSPPLVWVNVPPDTAELAVTITSLEGETEIVHWMVAGIEPTAISIDEDSIPLSAIEGPNSAGDFGWDGPCPASGETLDITITLHALSEPSALTPDMTAAEALDHLNGLPAVRTVTTATATR